MPLFSTQALLRLAPRVKGNGSSSSSSSSNLLLKQQHHRAVGGCTARYFTGILPARRFVFGGFGVKRLSPRKDRTDCIWYRRSSTSSKNSSSSSSSSKHKKLPKNDKDETGDISFVIPKSFAIGSLAGVMGSLAGMGGGFVMIPLMTSPALLKLSQHQAHGTSLFAVAATGVAGALGYQGHVQYDAAAAIAACGVVSARFGASATTKLSEAALKRALGIFMIAVAPLVPLKGYFHDLEENNEIANDDNNNNSKQPTTKTKTSNNYEWQKRLIPPAMIGIGSGFLAGLFGVGGGAVVVPALTIFTDVDHYQALGTSLCAMAFPAISGTMAHFQKGNVAMRVAPALAVGAFCGGYIGGRIGLRTNENALRWGFSGIMVTLGVRTLIR